MIRCFSRPARTLALKQFRCFSYKFAKSHEYIRISDSAVGITDHAQGLLGDIVYIDLPEVGSTFSAGESFAAVESVKAASDVYMPIDGEVIEVNEAVSDAPETINESAETEGWFIKIKVADEAQMDTLLSKEDYEKLCEEEEH